MQQPDGLGAASGESPDAAAGQLRFTGSGSEYFRIWAVNLGLTIVTLGVFSAWAKVRRLRYFYGNTQLAGSSFDFHGSPAAILRGRIVALIALIIYSKGPVISLTLYYAVAATIFFGLPWLFWRSMCFRLGNSSYRGVRFQFAGTLKQSYALFIPALLLVFVPQVALVGATQNLGVMPPAVAIVFGLISLSYLFLVPVFYHYLKSYQHGGAQFGQARFQYSGTLSGIARIFAVVLALYVSVFLVIGVLAGVAAGVATRLPSGATLPGVLAVVIPLIAVLLILVLTVLASYFIARTQRLVWSHTRIAGVAFENTTRFRALFKIELVNFILTLITLGLFRPFAVVRRTRYLVEANTWRGDPDAFTAAPVDARGAVGAEAMEMFGFDIAL